MNPLAWTKNLELTCGVVVSYWVLIEMVVNMKTAKAQVKFYGYLDQAAFDAGKDKVLEQALEIDFSTFDQDGSLAAGVIALVQAAQDQIAQNQVAQG